MGFHTFPIERADALEDPSRYRYCSREELLDLLDVEQSVETVADLGSGTGFYTDDVAPFVETCYAVDVNPQMHDLYREKGVPLSVECVTAVIDSLPFTDDHLDAAYSTMTHHEYANEAVQQVSDKTDTIARATETFEDPALSELARVIRPDGRLVIVDWSAAGQGESGPPLEERFGLEDIQTGLEASGFELEYAAVRPETVVVVARRLSTDGS